MIATKIFNRQYWLWAVLMCIGLGASAQCPTLYDYDGVASDSPYWYACSGGNYTLNLQSPNTIGDWTIDWGDGSGIQSGGSLVPPAFISHSYSAAVDTFIVVFTEVATGCEVVGVLVMEESTSASIQIPVGGLTQACAPQLMEFINSSTNVSETTVFTWDFGDGSPIEVYDHTNWGQTISHVYEKGTVDCETFVTLTAENYCNTIQGGASQATFSPIRIWDLDDAAITPSALVQCYPDTTFVFTNTTDRNCVQQGNIFQRQEYWNFGDYWGEGQDSIIGWTPWPPTFPQTISYPGIGTYEVMLIDSNFCGQDTAYIQVQIVEPPQAAFTASVDTICAGETVTFTNNSSANANTFSWYFGSGNWMDTGGGTISRTFNNPGSYDVFLAVSINGAVGSCSDTISLPIVVLPAPDAIINVDNPAACDSLAVNFTDGSTGIVNSWEWILPSGEVSSLQNPPTQYFTQPGAHTATLTVSNNNGCSNTNHFDVFVYETPTVGFVPSNVCQGTVSVFTDQSQASPGDEIVYWNWDFGGGFTSQDSVATHVFPSTGTYTIELEVGTPHCSATDTFNIIVEPSPTADFTADIDSGCGPLQVQFTNLSQGAVQYEWHFGDGGISTEEAPSHVFTNFTQSDVVFDVMLVASTTFGCSDTAYIPITVLPGAVASFSAVSTPGCAPFDALFTNNSQGATSYAWDFGDGSPVSAEENPVHTYVNQGLLVENFLVELIAYSANGCNDTAYTTVTAYPEPYFEFNMLPDSGCSPLSAQFPHINGAVDLQWNFGDGTIGNGQAPAHTYTNNTNQPILYNVQLIAMSAFGCVDTAYSDILVNPAPVAQMNVGILSGCAPLAVELFNNSINADSYLWNYGDGTTSAVDSAAHTHVFENNTGAPIEFTISLSAQTVDGCVHIMERVITVYPSVIADFDMTEAVCAQSDVQFVNQSENATSYDWFFGDGFIDLAESPIHSYFGGGADSVTYEVTLVATSSFGCTDTMVQSIVIHPQPIAEFSVGTAVGCAPLDITMENLSQNANAFHWNYGDNNESLNPDSLHNHVFENNTDAPITYTISLEATNAFGCVDYDDTEITVFPGALADFEVTPEGCTPFSPLFTNNAQGAMSYTWQFGDGTMSNGENPSHTFINDSLVDQEFEITLIVENQFGCNDTAIHTIVVHPAPQIDFSVADVPTCAPFDFSFTNESLGGTNYTWNFGDGTIVNDNNSTVNHTYHNNTAQPLAFDVVLTGTNDFGCSSTETITIDVLPDVIAAFFGDSIDCSPMQVGLLNESVGASTYNWYLDGEWISDQNNPNFQLINETDQDKHYEVTLRAQSFLGCVDTIVKMYTVLATPLADFNATPVIQTFPDATVEVENNSSGDNITSTWDWGNGTMSFETDPGSVTYGTWGNYTITLTVDNGICSDQQTRNITIDLPLPVADFTGEKSGCQPVTVQFQNTSEYGVNFYWQFGDGASSMQEHPVYTYFNPGTYTVSLTVTGPGGDMDTRTKEAIIEIYPQATAFFTANPQNVTIPDNPVMFFNLSNNATEYFWDFGDGNQSQEENPEHYYQEVGEYPVILIATNEYACADTFRLESPIIAEGGGQIVFPNAFTPSPTGSNNGYVDPSANNYNNDVFFPLSYGVEKYQLLIFNRWGELIFMSDEVNRGWDGYYKGNLCKQDVYVWKVHATFSDGREIMRAGDVTLIR